MPRQRGHLRILFSPRVLFNLEEADALFKEEGQEAYDDMMYKERDTPLKPGPLLNFAKALTKLNKRISTSENDFPVEIGISCKDSTKAAQRIMRSTRKYNLLVTTMFPNCRDINYKPIVDERVHQEFETDLFLTRNDDDAQLAINHGYGAAVISFPKDVTYTMLDGPVHIAFDCDAVAFGPSAEERFKEYMGKHKKYEDVLVAWQKNEATLIGKEHEKGPLTNFLQKITDLNKTTPNNKLPLFYISPITARGDLAIERGMDILNQFGIESNYTGAFLQNSPKSRYLEIYKPDLFFDDSIRHITSAEKICPTGRIPYHKNSILYKPK